jgi:hypothetical protein
MSDFTKQAWLNMALMGLTGARALTSSGGNIMKAFSNPTFSAAMFSDPERRVGEFGSTAKGMRNVGRIQKTSSCVDRAKEFLTKEAALPAFLGRIGRALTGPTAQRIGIGAGTVAAATLALKGIDSLWNSASTSIGQARGYRDMMDNYGKELSTIAQETEAPVPEDKIRSAYEALYAVAPDIAASPTLAAAQMAPIIREMGTIQGRVGDDPRIMLEQGLFNYKDPVELQSRIRPSEPISTSIVNAVGVVDKLKDITENPLAEGMLTEYGKSLGRTRAGMENPEVLQAARALASAQADAQLRAQVATRQDPSVAQALRGEAIADATAKEMLINNPDVQNAVRQRAYESAMGQAGVDYNSYGLGAVRNKAYEGEMGKYMAQSSDFGRGVANQAREEVAQFQQQPENLAALRAMEVAKAEGQTAHQQSYGFLSALRRRIEEQEREQARVRYGNIEPMEREQNRIQNLLFGEGLRERRP